MNFRLILFAATSLGAVACAALLGVSANTTLLPAPKNIERAPFPVQRCINMGNALEAPVEGEWGYKVEARHFPTIAQAGFDTVRIPIKWSAHAATTPPYTINPAFLARIDAVVNQGLASGLNVMINVHHYDELYADPDRHEPRLQAIWDQLSDHYRAFSPKLMFEIINEPRDAFSGSRVNKTQDAILARIRTKNPTRTVILAGDDYGALSGLANLKVPADPNVVATVHYYTPYEFTHQGAEWLPNPPPPGRVWPRLDERDQLERDVATMVAWRKQNSVPLFLGEFGTDVAVPMPGRIEWSRDVRLALEAANIPWCAYNFAGGFPLFSVPANRWNTPLLEALGLTEGIRPRR
jgi:endoglucanase